MAQNSSHVIVTEVPPGFLKRRTVRHHFSRFGIIMRMSIKDTYCVITFANERQARDAILHGTVWNDMPMKIDLTPDHDPFGTNEALINEELNWFAEDSSVKQKRTINYKSDTLAFETPPKKIIKGTSLGDSEAKSKFLDESKDRVKFDKSSATSRFLSAIKGKGKTVGDNSSGEHPLKSWFTDGDKVRPKTVTNKPIAQVMDEINRPLKEVESTKISSILKERKTNQSILKEECRPISQSFSTEKTMAQQNENSLPKLKRKALEECIMTLKSAHEIKSIQIVEPSTGTSDEEKKEVFKSETVKPASNEIKSSLSGDVCQLSENEKKEACTTVEGGIPSVSDTDKPLIPIPTNVTKNTFQSITQTTRPTNEIFGQVLVGKGISFHQNDSKSTIEFPKDHAQSVRSSEEDSRSIGNQGTTNVIVGKQNSTSMEQGWTNPLIKPTESIKPTIRYTDVNKQPIFSVENSDVSKLLEGHTDLSESDGKTVFQLSKENKSKLTPEDTNIFSTSKGEVKSIFGSQNKLILGQPGKSESIHSFPESISNVQDTTKVKSLFGGDIKKTSMELEKNKPLFHFSVKNESVPSNSEHKVTSIFARENKEASDSTEVGESLPKYSLFGQALSEFEQDHKRTSEPPVPNSSDTIDTSLPKHQDYIGTSMFADKSKGSVTSIEGESGNAALQRIEFGKALTANEIKQTSEENKPFSWSVGDGLVIPKKSDAKLLFNTKSIFSGSGIKEETLFGYKENKEISSKSIFADVNKESLNLFGDNKTDPIHTNQVSIFGNSTEPMTPSLLFGDDFTTKSKHLSGTKIKSNVSELFGPLVTNNPFETNTNKKFEEEKEISKNKESGLEKLMKTSKSIFADGSNEAFNLFTDKKIEQNNTVSIFDVCPTESNKPPALSDEDTIKKAKYLDIDKVKPTASGLFEPPVTSKPFQTNTNRSSAIVSIEERKETLKNIETFKEKSLDSKFVGEIKLSSKDTNESQTVSSSKTSVNVHSFFKFSNDNELTLKPPVEILRHDETSSMKTSDDKYISKSQNDYRVTTKTTDNPIYGKVAVMLKDKLDILEERDRQVRTKLEKVVKMDNTTHGICPDMCPEKERVLRELRGIVAPYESNPDGSMDHGKAIKEYARSSADQDEPLPQDLRPEPVLTMTMSYLINCIISRIDDVEDENLSNWYDFCWGRLRAIRKDIIQQQLCDEKTIVILEQCARFHIACYDRLWGTSKSQFDDKINTETLVNCLQSLMHMYEDLRKRSIICPNEAEFKAYLILLNLNSGFLISEYKQYSHRIMTSSTINEAVKIHLAYTNNMFSAYFKLAKRTTYLNACLMQRFFQHVRIQALNIMVKGFSLPNKFTNIPVKLVMDMLKIDLYEDCVSFCDSVGLTVTNDRRSFQMARNDVYAGESVFTIETSSSLVRNKRIRISEAVAGAGDCLPIYLQHSVHNSFNGDGQLMEGAHDASDQEEKMLRDDLERKLAMSQLKSSSKQKHESVERDEHMSSTTEVNFDELLTEDISEEEDMQEDEYSESENQLLHTSTTEPMDVGYQESESSEETSQSSSIISEISSPHTSPMLASLPSVQTSQSISSLTPFGFQLQSPGPIFSNMFKQSPVSDKPSTPVKSSPLVETKLVPVFTFNTPMTNCAPPSFDTDKFHSEQIRPIKSTSPKTPKNDMLLSTKLQKAAQKDNREEIYMNKLRKKLSENMKKISARKYLRIWKEKTEKLKSIKEFEAMVLHNMSAEQYIKLWGKPSVKRSLNLNYRLSTRKRANIMVQFILHTDIINKVDKNVRKLGQAVVDILGKVAVKRAHMWGNIAQPNPVFWKLVISLPTPPEGGTMFTTNLKNWFKAVFYQKPESVLSKVEIQFSSAGVPVFTSVSVVEGTQNLDECRNLTALIVVRGRDWESTSSTENRIIKLLSLRNSPIPVAILNVGHHLDEIKLNTSESITHLQQCLWPDASIMNEVLCNLAYNVHLYNLKVKPFCNLMEVYSEKLFDCLQQDKYLNDSLDIALTDPNNIILLYNNMIDKIEQEIIHCKVQNYYGTALEFKEDLKKYNYSFPDNYKDINFEKSFSLRCRKCKLNPLKTDFQTTKELVSFLRNYCDNIGCESALRKLLRIIKPPDEDSNIKLRDHLQSVHWLHFIEQLTKEMLTSPLLTFNVVYRENVIKEIVGSHVWLESGIIKC